MKKWGTKKHATDICAELEHLYPKATCSLTFSSPLEILIATILSAQCTDIRVNLVTPTLFKKYPSARAFMQAPLEQLEEDIRSTGFYRNKARNIQLCCTVLAEKYGGEVPAEMDELLLLPGVGRKTANCVLGAAYGIASGVVVDTHVGRLSVRMGLSEEKLPEKIESDLMQILPREKWIRFSHLMIQHGRHICDARSPKCQLCTLVNKCRFTQKNRDKLT